MRAHGDSDLGADNDDCGQRAPSSKLSRETAFKDDFYTTHDFCIPDFSLL